MLQNLAHLNHWQIALGATLILLQGAVFTVFPEEVVITALGYFWHQGKIGFLEAVLAIQMGLLPANFGLALLARFIGWKILTQIPFRWFMRESSVRKALSKVAAHGDKIVFTTRFTPIIRGPIYIAVGLSDMPMRRFLLVDALASLIQIPALLIFGYFCGSKGLN